jgi:outer membrane protein OmpA-like peptidoglycan-associated protein
VRRIHSLVFTLPFVAACAAHTVAPSRQLVDARNAYARAAQSNAPAEAPNSLAHARVMLEAAEQVHLDSPGSQQERELAYIATRRSQAAIAHANTRQAQREAQRARQQLRRSTQDAARAVDAARAQAEAARVQAEAARARADAANQQAQAAAQQQQAAEQAAATAQSERDRALQALRDLGNVAQEERSLVLTIPGEVLFRDDQASLLPHARAKLDELADALGSLGPDQTFVIEGHTDSRGTDSYNERLSRLRAMAVRSYLIDRGVDPDRIRAVGRGEEEPIASNTDPEGRANNRRVEIVVTPAAVSKR